MASSEKFKQVRLSTEPSREALEELNIGDVVYLDGTVYTAREGVYKRVIEEGNPLPPELDPASAANFHCSPAATITESGEYNMGAVTATASFRFSKWIGQWLEKSQSKLILGKGGMSSEDYKKHFVPHGAVYLTTVGYGTGALLGRGVTKVENVYWRDELGLAQAMWVIKVENFGPFIVDGDMQGNSLFECENEKISAGLDKVYEGTRPAVLKRFGEIDDRGDEVI